MAEIRWTPQAAADIAFIAEFIEKDSPHYARLFVADVVGSVERLAFFPSSGRVVPELNDADIRELIQGNYRVIYRVQGDAVQVLTVYHGARLLDPSLLK